MKTLIESEVNFVLDEHEGFAVPGRDPHTYFRVTNIRVTLKPGKEPYVWGLGERCKKDGGVDKRTGKYIQTIDVPDPASWVEKARLAVICGPEVSFQ